MGKKDKNKRSGIVFSTDPDYEYAYQQDDDAATLPPQQQKLRVLIDRKQRKGKEVTLVTGFVGSDDDLKDLAKALKNKCGVGGSAKDGEIILQGDKRDQVVQYLLAESYSGTTKSGG